MLNSCCVSAFRRAENVHRQIVTGKCHLLGGASRDANSSLGSLGARADKFCHSSHLSIVYCRDSNSCLKLLVSRSKKTFVIFQRGRSRNFKKFIKTTGCSFAVHKWQLKLYQFTTQVAPPFSEQYLQEGSWQLTEYLIEDQEIHCKKLTCLRLPTLLFENQSLQMDVWEVWLRKIASQFQTSYFV